MASAFVVDTSVVMTWCFEDEASAYADTVLDSLDSSLMVVPPLWQLEVANVLLVAERRKRISRAGVERFLSLLKMLPITIEHDLPGRAFGEVLALAREYNLSSYDAAYLDLALRLGLHLATLDAALLKAARKCKVKVWKG